MKARYLIVLGSAVAGGSYYLGLQGCVGFSPAEAPAMQQGATLGGATLGATALGVGALGRIEPRSRVIRVSHEAGLNGARIAQVLVQEGQTVKAGETVAIFSDHARREAEVNLCQREIEAMKARIAAVEAERVDAVRDFERKDSLSKTGSASASSRDAAEMRLHKAAAEVEAAKATIKQAEANNQLKELQVLQAVVTAPINGTVIYIYARPGERAGDNGILEMADLSSLDVVAEVYEADIPRVKVDQRAVIKIAGMETQYAASVREIGFLVRKNRVNDTDPLADRDTRIVEVRLTLEDEALPVLRHQIYRQVQLQIQP
jgi:HlyD family secretion protein